MEKSERPNKQIGLADILGKLPNIIKLKYDKDLSGERYDFFLLALGFEERCFTIPERLATIRGFTCKNALLFDYSTNIEDNEANRPRMVNALEIFTDSVEAMQCDSDDFARDLRSKFACIQDERPPKVIFDISVCSSKLLISVIKILLEFNIHLRIVYTEAEKYHPTFYEFGKDPKRWTTDEEFGIARGVGKVLSSTEYPGGTRELPNIIIAFPTFKPERTKAIITHIDPAISMKPEKRVIWIVGDPNMDEQARIDRIKMIRDINEISEKYYSIEVTTLDYKKTIAALESIYKQKNLEYHINISALGSKMQCLGISIFCYIRPDVSVFLALPKNYNSKQYSEGYKEVWTIDFGDLGNIRSLLNTIGMLEIPKSVENEFFRY